MSELIDINEGLPEKVVRENSIEPALFLEAFVENERREEAFTQLMCHYGGMVQASAYRRTGSMELAEEITQTVFAILARKASSLLSHYSLTAWIFKTTKMEAAKAMRSEYRRQNKHEALAVDMDALGLEEDDLGTWKEILPLLDESLDRLNEQDRQIIFRRFFEGKKFREIAQVNGSSVAASKMQLKRALQKLYGLLTARGAIFSETALVTVLASQLVGSMPAKAATILVSQSLATSSSVGTGTLLTNAFFTMNATKQTTLIGAVLIGLMAIPAVQQSAEASRLQTELGSLHDQKNVLENQSAERVRAYQSRQVRSAGARAVHQLLKAGSEGLTGQAMLEQFTKGASSGDTPMIIKALLPAMSLDSEKLNMILEEMAACKGHDQVKPEVMELVALVSPMDQPQKVIEQMIRLNPKPHRSAKLLGEWASKDPNAALAWFEKKRSAGELLGDGSSNPERFYFASLMSGLAKEDPARAVALYLTDENSDYRAAASRFHLFPDALSLDGGKGEKQLRHLLENDKDQNNRHRIVENVLSKLGERGGSLDEGLALARSYLNDPKMQADALSAMTLKHSELSFDQRADWLMAHVPSELQGRSMQQMIRGRIGEMDSVDIKTVEKWIDRQNPGGLRDQSLTAFTGVLMKRRNFEAAYQRAGEIGDANHRGKEQKRVMEGWLRYDKAKAMQYQNRSK